MGSFARLPLHADVVPGLTSLADAGFRLVTLSNGFAAVAEALFDAGRGDAGVRATALGGAGAGVEAGCPSYRWAAEVCESTWPT